MKLEIGNIHIRDICFDNKTWYGNGILTAVTGVQWLCSTVLLSMVRIYVLMVLGSHVAKEALLSKLTELLEQAVVWSLSLIHI